jgi:hypothetical protein
MADRLKNFQACKLEIHTLGGIQELTAEDKIPSGFYDRVGSSVATPDSLNSDPDGSSILS